MANRRSLRALASVRSAALCCTLLAGAWPIAAQANGSGPPAISVGEPEGFSSLTGEHELLVDVFYGGVRKGEAKISSAPGSIRFLDPAAAIALLPPLTDDAAVAAALASGSLATNAELACSKTADPAKCGRLSPAVAGVIFDRDRFRVDVFVNPRFLAVHDNVEDLYLPEPQKGLAVINAVGAIVSGRLEQGSPYVSLQDQLVVGSGARRLRADLTYANAPGFGAERLALEWDRPELRYSAGALWAPGNDLTGRRKLIGFGVERQIDTRLDKDEVAGSPLVVYLDQRSRVDVVRDGRVLNSAMYEAGNQQVDTSNLPDGSYEVVLRIDEPGRPTREERRFFTKSRRIPAPGRTDFFAFAGMLAAGTDSGSLRLSGHPFVQGGIAHRLNTSWAVEGQLQASDRGASAEAAATLLTRVAQLRAVAVADLDGGFGAILQVSSSGTSRLNFNLDLRHIETRSARAAVMAGAPVDPFAAADLAPFGQSYSQAGAVVSYSLADIRFVGAFSYRDEEAQRASYSIGPSLEWDVLRRGPFTLTLRGEVAATERGASEFAGLSLRLLGGRTSLTALGGARASGIPGDAAGNGPVATLAGSWQAPAAGGELQLGGGVEHQPRQDDLVLSSQFTHPLGTLSGDFVHSSSPAGDGSQYTFGLQTTVAAGGGTVRVAGRTTTQSLIVARVDGASDADRFDVLVNEQLAGTIEGTQPLTLALPSYRAYAVRIRPTGQALLAYDSAARTVGLYPGAVSRLEWKVAPVVVKFGRLVGPDGAPLAHASLTGQGVWSETDGDGFFQIDAPDGIALTVTLPDGRSFPATLPPGRPSGGIARLGPITCCTAPAMALNGLDPRAAPRQKGTP